MTPNEFKAIRLQLNLTQNELAKLLDTWPQSINNWEAGRYPISERTKLAMEMLLVKKGRK